MNEFTNKLDSRGIYYSRYIASWVNEGGRLDHKGLWDFKDWLKSLGLDDTEIKEITYLVKNGKLELETSAREFIMNRKQKMKTVVMLIEEIEHTCQQIEEKYSM